MYDMGHLNVRELHRRTGAAVEGIMRPAKPAAPGFPPEHWKLLKRFPKFKDDSGRFISEDRQRG